MNWVQKLMDHWEWQRRMRDQIAELPGGMPVTHMCPFAYGPWPERKPRKYSQQMPPAAWISIL